MCFYTCWLNADGVGWAALLDWLDHLLLNLSDALDSHHRPPPAKISRLDVTPADDIVLFFSVIL